MITNLTAAQLDELIEKNEKPVIIDFFAVWCGPCRMFAPIFESASEANDSICFAKADVDAAPELAERFKIQAVPTIVAIKDGKVVHQSSGLMNSSALSELISQLV